MSLRVFHPGPPPPVGGELRLGAEEARHLVRVRRARAGEAVEVLDGIGGVAAGELVSAEADNARVLIQRTEQRAAPPARVLAVGLPKGGAFEEIIRTATELGATAVQPLLAARSELRLEGGSERLARKRARWRAAAVEAGKQSGNPWFPEIGAPLSPEDWLAAAGRGRALRLVAALTPGAQPLGEILAAESGSGAPSADAGDAGASFRIPHSALHIPCIVAVGPEGDFTPEEYARFAAAGFHALRLPGHVLRVETACAAALAALGAHG